MHDRGLLKAGMTREARLRSWKATFHIARVCSCVASQQEFTRLELKKCNRKETSGKGLEMRWPSLSSKGSPPNRKRPPNEKATDDYHYEKFKKMNRRYWWGCAEGPAEALLLSASLMEHFVSVNCPEMEEGSIAASPCGCRLQSFSCGLVVRPFAGDCELRSVKSCI